MLITYQIHTGYNDFLVLKRGIHILHKYLVRKVTLFYITYEHALGLWFTCVS
jgi:hypothetical protein